MIVWCSGRRSGKTVLGEVVTLTYAAIGLRVAWIVPSYKNGRPLWRAARQAVGPLINEGIVQKKETERTIEFFEDPDGHPINGFLGLYSTDNADAIRGEHFDLVVCDEAAMMDEDAWTDCIMPCLADTRGKALLISTPRSKNWFYHLWLQGQDPDNTEVKSFRTSTYVNPSPNIRRAADKARLLVPERTFRTEWLAEFVDDAGGVFNRIRECVRGKIETKPTYPSDEYVIGLDLAKYNDYTVMTVIERRRRQVVDFLRFNRIDWALQEEKIIATHERWNNAQIWMDSTGVGDPIWENLTRRGLPVVGYKFDLNSKKRLIDNAVLLVEKQGVFYPDIPVLLAELGAYQYDPLPSGNVRTNAPAGMHDDCVIAFALACWGLQPAASGSVTTGMDELLDSLTQPASIDARKLLGNYNF